MPLPSTMKTTLLIDRRFGFTAEQKREVYKGLKDADFGNIVSLKRKVTRLMRRWFPGDDGYVMVAVTFTKVDGQTTCTITVARA